MNLALYSFDGHYYYVYKQHRDWQSAENHCESLGGHLATVSNQEEQTFIENIVKKANVPCWLGGYKSGQNYVCGYAKETTNHNSDHSIAAIVGGVAGKNSGTLIGCKVVGSTVKGESQRWDGNDCGGSGDIAIAYVGGIVGEITSGGKIEDCNANEMTLIKGYGYFRFWFMNNSKPHITVYAGGVVGCLDEGANIETCASDLTNDSFELQASYGKKNDGWGSEDTYCTAMKGSVIGNNK